MSDFDTESVLLHVRGEETSALLCRPTGTPRGGVVLGAEAVGINRFIVGVAQSLASAGYLAIVPDYFHGAGPDDPEGIYDPDHIPEIQRYIHALDFARGTEDMMVAADYLLDVCGVDGVAVWGYCTGGTMSMMAGCVDRRVRASVLFYPSQPTFAVHDSRCPVDPIDLIWNLHGEALLLVGSDDPLWPEDLRHEVGERLRASSVAAEIIVYPGANHVFAGHFGDSYHAVAAEDSWARGIAVLERNLG